MAPVVYLAPQPGEKILDLCAAPGGKSTQIAAAMRGQGLLVSNEIHPARAKILSENIERMGIRNALVTGETPKRLAQAFPEYFDRILVDAPCSGEGMFRRNEEARKEWSPDNVQLCADRQDEILNWAADMLTPGGRLVYSTCTFAPLENEGTIARFLMQHPEFEILPTERLEGMAPGMPEWASGEQIPDLVHTIRLWPHRLRGEGHYLAVLEKAGIRPKENRIPLEKGIKEKDCREYLEFCRENLCTVPKGRLIRFGDQLYLAPEQLPSLDKLRVLRPGLHLGTMKKGRFEPSHALALALMPKDVKYSHDLTADSDEMAGYLKGQTFAAEGEKGWYLITVDGYSIGWGKLSGGVMKNHYPKGLRKF